jgi:hypothetical protein
MAKSKTTETAIEARFFDIDLTDAERTERRDQAAEMVGQLVQARQDEKALAKQKKLVVEDLPITKQARESRRGVGVYSAERWQTLCRHCGAVAHGEQTCAQAAAGSLIGLDRTGRAA